MARECVNEYLETVGGQIRWRRARRVLLRELSDHIADQAAAFEAEGRSPEEALAGAVAEMGEPEAVGRELDRLHRPRNRWGLAVTVAALFAAGVLLQLFAAGLMGDAKDVFYFRRQVLGLLLAAGVLTGLWFSDYTLLLRRKWAPAAALLLLCLGPILCTPLLPFYSYPGYQLALYSTLLLPVPYAALVASLRGKGPLAVLLCGAAVLALPLFAWLAPSSASWLVSEASMLLVLLAAVGLGWFRGKRRWNLLAALGPALTILPLLFLRHLEYAAWRIDAFLGPDLFYERLRMGELPSLFVGSSSELLLAEAAQGLGRWVFWAAAGLIVLFAALLLRRIETLRGDRPVILTGDFNAEPDSPVIAHVVEGGLLKSTGEVAAEKYGPSWSFADFGQIPEAERPLIDYIFIGGDLRSDRYEVLPDLYEGGYLSDHAPVAARLTFTR